MLFSEAYRYYPTGSVVDQLKSNRINDRVSGVTLEPFVGTPNQLRRAVTWIMCLKQPEMLYFDEPPRNPLGYLQEYMDVAQSSTTRYFEIRMQSGKPVGHVGLQDIDTNTRTGEWLVMIGDKAALRNHIATTSVNMLLAYAKLAGFEKITANVREGNISFGLVRKFAHAEMPYPGFPNWTMFETYMHRWQPVKDVELMVEPRVMNKRNQSQLQNAAIA